MTKRDPCYFDDGGSCDSNYCCWGWKAGADKVEGSGFCCEGKERGGGYRGKAHHDRNPIRHRDRHRRSDRLADPKQNWRTETDRQTETEWRTDYQTATQTSTLTQSARASTIVQSVTVSRTSVFTTTNSAGKSTVVTTTFASVAAETSVTSVLAPAAANTSTNTSSTPTAASVDGVVVVSGLAILAARPGTLLFIGSYRGCFDKEKQSTSSSSSSSPATSRGYGSSKRPAPFIRRRSQQRRPSLVQKGPDHSHTPVPARDEVGDLPAPMSESHVTSPAQSPMVQGRNGGGMGARWFGEVVGDVVHEVHGGEGALGGSVWGDGVRDLSG
ncbi:hypothetical protein LTS18_008696 [Coniosporium uncinatum]|uniref:Uncharacterized protein n=1 Tax=Coniosporium uncinatum TaxID=93489 RepID=A0ACC3D1R5_9PEZI|nr:hypothetical protein LTS18_008696 [Coniosporium uncinatum]